MIALFLLVTALAINPMAARPRSCSPSKQISNIHPLAVVQMLNDLPNTEHMSGLMLKLHEKVKNEGLKSLVNPDFYTIYAKFNIAFDNYFKNSDKFDSVQKELVRIHNNLGIDGAVEINKTVCGAWNWYTSPDYEISYLEDGQD